MIFPRHFCVILGDWKFEDWHLYRWRRHVARSGQVSWWDWERLL